MGASALRGLRAAGVGVCCAVVLAGCTRRVSGPPSDPVVTPQTPWEIVAPETVEGAAPDALIGDFEDDYGNRYSISDSLWTQHPHGRFVVHAWSAQGRFLIARNHPENSHAPGLWTRVDWVELSDMAPWGWAFCLTAFEAPTRADAEAAAEADRSAPREGCGGFPFSRMKRVE